MIRVLFVCLGNICRSPMAEGIFRHLVNEAGLSDHIAADSAGIGPWHVGEPAHTGTRRVLQEHGIPYDGRARQFTRADFTRFDYILAMDEENLADIRARLNGPTDADIRLLMDFAPELGIREVPDPYYDGSFDQVYTLVRTAVEKFLAYLREKHGL
jgi:protein-tyrosine phosphatase